MKLFVRPIAPNAVKVLIFLAERGIALDTVDVGLLDPADFRRIAPLERIPVLETDDGLFISESLTICQYLDGEAEGASLFGESLDERALVSMWERRAEQLLLNPAIEYGHHTQPMFAGALRQFPEWAREHVALSRPMLTIMDGQLADHRFLAGDRFTMADLTAFLGLTGLVGWGAIPTPAQPALRRWINEVGSRPSMAPLHALASQFGLPMP